SSAGAGDITETDTRRTDSRRRQRHHRGPDRARPTARRSSPAAGHEAPHSRPETTLSLNMSPGRRGGFIVVAKILTAPATDPNASESPPSFRATETRGGIPRPPARLAFPTTRPRAPPDPIAHTRWNSTPACIQTCLNPKTPRSLTSVF